jgi:L-ornithine Nalpha-acyltransferase
MIMHALHDETLHEPLPPLNVGRYRAHVARSADDLDKARALRWLAFRAAHGHSPRDGRDRDAFDAGCLHVVVADRAGGKVVASYRLRLLESGRGIANCYSAQFYHLDALSAYDRPMAELGRLCLHPDWHDPDIFRTAWGFLAWIVERWKIEMLFGCTSFQGTDAMRYDNTFAFLNENHSAPVCWAPRIKSPDAVCFGLTGADWRLNRRQALKGLPTLLRAYLAMGGWVSDHAVVDDDLDTLHVFTALEVKALPEARARTLRRVLA